MRQVKLKSTALVTGALLLVLSGCLAGRSKPTRFYVLSSLYSSETKSTPVADLRGTAVGVGPVRIPMGLDRPQITTRTAQNEIRLTEYAEWGEPLGTNFTRVLAENLSLLLATENIAIFPYLKATPRDYQVTVDVTDFIGTPGGDVLLRAWWTVFGENGRTDLLRRYANLNQPVPGDDIAAMVQAQSRTIETLSRQIAEAVKALAEGKDPPTIK